METSYLLALAGRAVRKFGPKLPPGIEKSDAVQDAVAAILRWEPLYDPIAHNCNKEAYLVMKAWGTLKDTYDRLWVQEYRARPDRQPTTNPTNRALKGESLVHDEYVPLNPRNSRSGYDSATDDSEAEMARAEVVSDVRTAIGLLPDEERVIITKLMNGMTQTAIADELGVSQAYVSQIVKRAKSLLAETLKDYNE